MDRREYKISVTINERHITKVVIDPHYELKHSSSVSDEIIVQLVRLLDGGVFPAQETSGVYEYFVTDRLKLAGKISVVLPRVSP